MFFITAQITVCLKRKRKRVAKHCHALRLAPTCRFGDDTWPSGVIWGLAPIYISLGYFNGFGRLCSQHAYNIV